MQFTPKVSKAVAEIEKIRSWLKSQQGIKRYCQENPEAYQGTLELLLEAERTLYRSIDVFTKGRPSIVR
jgi:hypothetical protein